MKKFKVTWKYKYGNSYSYSNTETAESREKLIEKWNKANESKKNPLKIIRIKEI